MLKRLVAIAALSSLASCGLVYVSPKVIDADGNVTIVPLTPESVEAANRSKYVPREIPAVFFQTAYGTGTLRGAGATPEPTLDAQSRPSALVLRLPETPQRTPTTLESAMFFCLRHGAAGAPSKNSVGCSQRKIAAKAIQFRMTARSPFLMLVASWSRA